jgi:hypothetical protein
MLIRHRGNPVGEARLDLFASTSSTMISPGAFKAIAAFFLFTPLILGQSSGFKFSLQVSFIAASCVVRLPPLLFITDASPADSHP